MGEWQRLELSDREFPPGQPPGSAEPESRPIPQEIAQFLRKAYPLEIQIVDTPKALETAVSASFAASHHQINRTLVGADLYSVRQPAEALRHSEDAFAMSRSRWPRLEMFSRLLAAESLIDLGRSQEALCWHDDSLPVFSAVSDFDAIKVKYLQARLLDGLGDVRLADKLFRETLEQCSSFDAFRPSLITRTTIYVSLYKRGAFGKALESCRETVKWLEGQERAHVQMKLVWGNLTLATQRQIVTLRYFEQIREYVLVHWGMADLVAPTFRRENDVIPFPTFPHFS